MSRHKLYRLVAAGFAAALTVLASVAGASGAEATPKPQVFTSVNLVVPRYIAITSPQKPVNPSINCPPDGCIWDYGYRATWTTSAAGKPQDTIIFSPYDMVPNPTLVQGGTLKDTNQLGLWTWTPVADQWAIVPANQMNSPLMDIRLGSRASLAATRSGLKVTLKIGAAHYWQSKHNWAAYTNATGLVQARNAGSTTWSNLREIHPDSAGWETWSYVTSVVKDYRVVITTATYIWGSESPTRKA